MRRSTALKSVCIAFCLATGITPAKAELPLIDEIAVPNGGTIRVSLPQRMCAYPKQVNDRVAEFLSNGPDKLRLMGAAGDCDGVDRLMREGTAIVKFSLQIAMFDTQIDPAKRSTPEAYRRLCFERFPQPKEELGSDQLVKAFKEADGRLDLGGEVSLGLLAATRDAVFGGLELEISRGSDKFRMIEVVACFAPGNVPVLWTFQNIVPSSTSVSTLADMLRALLQLAQFHIKTTADLNRTK